MIKSPKLHRVHSCHNDSHGQRIITKNETKFVVPELIRMSLSTQNLEESINFPAFWV